MDEKRIQEILKGFKVYISGPITGDPNAKERFEKAQKFLEEKWTVINPFEIPEAKKLDGHNATWEDYMKADIRELATADFIYMLKGWRKSRGARLEHKLAKALKIAVLYETEKQRKKTKKSALEKENEQLKSELIHYQILAHKRGQAYLASLKDEQELKQKLEKTEKIIKTVMETKPCELCNGGEKGCNSCKDKSEWGLAE